MKRISIFFYIFPKKKIEPNYYHYYFACLPTNECTSEQAARYIHTAAKAHKKATPKYLNLLHFCHHHELNKYCVSYVLRICS